VRRIRRCSRLFTLSSRPRRYCLHPKIAMQEAGMTVDRTCQNMRVRAGRDREIFLYNYAEMAYSDCETRISKHTEARHATAENVKTVPASFNRVPRRPRSCSQPRFPGDPRSAQPQS